MNPPLSPDSPVLTTPAMTLVTVDPRSDARWQTLVEQQRSDVFHAPAWIQVLSDTYGLEVRAHVALDDAGAPIGGVPYCHISDIFGDRIAMLPFSDYCDPLVTEPVVWDALMAEPLLQRCPVLVRCLHNDLPLADPRFELVKKAKWHGLDLAPDLDALWRGFHDSTHRAIHKSQRNGVVVGPARSVDELRQFYEMHLAVRKYKYQMLAQPYRFFENIWHHFLEAGAGFLMLARYQERVIAGALFLRWKNTLYYKFNASAPENLEHRPTDQIIWEAIRRARDSGCSALDFGLSDWDQDGLIRYKRKFGSAEKTISFLRYTPVSPRRAEKQTRELLSALTRLFVDRAVPDEVTERGGDNLYRYFS
jgi:CelD/BcsL family acetyltransferase involved in cellulose biosynthesis